MSLNPGSSTPLYIQIKEYVSSQINAGVFPGGSRLPSERDLALMLDVSRMTVRQALQALAQEKLIYSQAGKGYYVQKSRIDQDLGLLTSFSEEMQQRGVIPRSRVVKAEIQHARPGVTDELQVPVGAEVVFLQRIRLADNTPIALESAFLVHEMCPGILEKYDFNHESLYRVLREDYTCPLALAKQCIQARLPTLTEQKLLGIEAQLPVLSNTRVTYTKPNKPVEYVTSIYLGDRYQLCVILD